MQQVAIDTVEADGRVHEQAAALVGRPVGSDASRKQAAVDELIMLGRVTAALELQAAAAASGGATVLCCCRSRQSTGCVRS